MEKTVNFIGLGFGAVDAPWENTKEEFWGINNAYIYGKLNKLFVMHSAETTIKSTQMVGRDEISFKEAFSSNSKMEAIALNDFAYVYNKKLNRYGTAPLNKLETVLNDKDYELVTVTTKYPLKEALKISGGANFSSTVPYMFALAIIQGFKRIRLYGFEVWSGSDNEYKDQGPCVERWQALARGHGIKTDISFEVVPTLRQETNLYGYKL